MNCKITQSKILDYSDNALNQDEMRAFEVHLCGCNECREEYRALKAFSDTCAEFVVYPEKPYSFNVLRARMATIRPLDEVVAFMPKMRSQGLVARFAMTMLLIAFAVALPTATRGTRESYAAAQRPFTEEKEKWHEDYQQELDAQYRRQSVTKFRGYLS